MEELNERVEELKKQPKDTEEELKEAQKGPVDMQRVAKVYRDEAAKLEDALGTEGHSETVRLHR